jgi:hypothetical protein
VGSFIHIRKEKKTDINRITRQKPTAIYMALNALVTTGVCEAPIDPRKNITDKAAANASKRRNTPKMPKNRTLHRGALTRLEDAILKP